MTCRILREKILPITRGFLMLACFNTPIAPMDAFLKTVKNKLDQLAKPRQMPSSPSVFENKRVGSAPRLNNPVLVQLLSALGKDSSDFAYAHTLAQSCRGPLRHDQDPKALVTFIEQILGDQKLEENPSDDAITKLSLGIVTKILQSEPKAARNDIKKWLQLNCSKIDQCHTDILIRVYKKIHSLAHKNNHDPLVMHMKFFMGFLMAQIPAKKDSPSTVRADYCKKFQDLFEFLDDIDGLYTILRYQTSTVAHEYEKYAPACEYLRRAKNSISRGVNPPANWLDLCPLSIVVADMRELSAKCDQVSIAVYLNNGIGQKAFAELMADESLKINLGEQLLINDADRSTMPCVREQPDKDLPMTLFYRTVLPQEIYAGACMRLSRSAQKIRSVYHDFRVGAKAMVGFENASLVIAKNFVK